MSQAVLLVGNVRFSVELPEHIVEAVNEHLTSNTIIEFPGWGASKISDVLRSMISHESRPSSLKQIEYAEMIASSLGISAPNDVEKSEICGKFIDEHQAAFKEAVYNKKEEERYIKYLFSQTGRVSRWKKAKELIVSGASVEFAADQMGVKPNTIEKYLAELNSWEGATSGTEEYELVMQLLQEYDSGTNLYKKYLPGTIG